MEQPFKPKIPALDLSRGTELLNELLKEAEEHLTYAERAMAVLKMNADSSEDIEQIYRAFHTIKGAAGFMSLEDIRFLAFETEAMLSPVRKKVKKINDALLDATRQSIDALRRLLTLLREQMTNGGQLKSAYFDVSPVLAVIQAVVDGATEPQKEVLPPVVDYFKTAGKDPKIETLSLPTEISLALGDVTLQPKTTPPSAPEIMKTEDNSGEIKMEPEKITPPPAAVPPETELSSVPPEKEAVPPAAVPLQAAQGTPPAVPSAAFSPKMPEPPKEKMPPVVQVPRAVADNAAPQTAAPSVPVTQNTGGTNTASSKETPAPAAEFSFTPKVPVIDFSAGTDIITEFITESEDHLSNAENSILSLEKAPGNSDDIDRIFRAFHTIKGVSSFLNLEDIKTLTHNAETVMDSVRKGVRGMEPNIVDAMLQSIDAVRRLLALLRGQLAANGVQSGPYFDITPVLKVLDALIKGKPAETAAPPAPPKKIGEILVEKEIVTPPELDTALEKQRTAVPPKKIGEILVEEGAATPSQINRTLQEQQKASLGDSVIKIGAAKLDNLIDTVGELVISGTQIIQNPFIRNSEDIKLTNDITQMEKIIRDIQDITMTLRLVPIKPVFQKMTRVIHDLSKKSGKEIAIKLSGEHTEIDKNIIDLISDPLMHMVRNSIDHGIEPPEKRRQAGKPAAGTIELNAFHKGGTIVIQVIDDGAGLNKERILKKGREQGLVKEDEVLEDNRIFNLIFQPGFSTAEKVTDISGRGVGMDVVKRNVEKLRGRIEIESEEGKGSVFSIKLPLTLAIIDGVILEVGEQRYIVPVSSIVKFVRPKKGDISTPGGEKEIIQVHDQLYDLIRMNDFFHVTPRYSDIDDATVCVVESDYGKACIVVDEILGQQQVVIKALGEWFQEIKYVAGGAILGDGRVGLILDINNIIAHQRSA